MVLLSPVVLAGCLGSGSLVGEPAPPFELILDDGRIVNETTFLGRFVVLDLMATWCGPCVLEVAHLREIQARYGDRVQIVSVGIDPTFDTDETLGKFGEEHGADWPYAIDHGRKLAQAYRLAIVPKLIIIDPEGRVVLERQGEVLPAAMARVIDPAGAPVGGVPLALPATVALVLGFLAPLNPYRRLHRRSRGIAADALAAGLLVLLGVAAWGFAGFASSRATYGSLALGLAAAGAVVWWLARARRKAETPVEEAPSAGAASLDRAYEAAPHFGLVLVLALQGVSAAEFALPILAFLAGGGLGLAVRDRLPGRTGDPAGLLGLALAAAGLLLFGARILAV